MFVGEWVDDMPKAGVYSEVDDPENPRPERYFLLKTLYMIIFMIIILNNWSFVNVHLGIFKFLL